MTRPRVLIEEDFPVEALGVESRRERGASSALPPLYFLHVWWARRPLTISRAAVLGSLLPADTDPTWFLRILGIQGDPTKTFARIQAARLTGEDLGTNPYGYPRAFSVPVSPERITAARERFKVQWGTEDVMVFDPMAGGGSIPFEGLRFGLSVLANDLNPVAHVIEQATLTYPKRYGLRIVDTIRTYARTLQTAVADRTTGIFATSPDERVWGHLWAHTAICPSCSLEVPLSPNWWLENTAKQRIAVAWTQGDDNRLRPHVVDLATTSMDPEQGTVKKGSGVCPGCHNVFDGEEIKRQAQTGGLGVQLYALALKVKGGLEFRVPTPEDEAAVRKAESLLARKLPEWEAKGWVPTEEVYPGFNTDQIRNYGVYQWKDMFPPRQLLSLLTYLEAFQEVKQEVLANHSLDEARAILTYLGFAFDKLCDYNSRMTRWHASRTVIAGTFDRHDYAFKWSFAEMNLTAPGLGFDWAVDQVIDAYEGLCKLMGHQGNLQWFEQTIPDPTIRLGSATDLYDVANESIHAVVVDPPYYDNVMYSEMADFFYVWQRRTIGDLYVEAFGDEFTPKDQEAIANRSRFSGKKKDAENMAKLYYQTKIQESLSEMHRVLRADGVLTVMFTHKRADAWDSLATALLNAGFEITASWPVHTESEHSLQIAKKNSAESTIMLVCRKREASRGGWWDDLLPLVRERVLERAQTFQTKGFRKLDLMLATYGPALQVLSEHWPVKDSTGQLIQPERVLEEARSLVTQLRVTELVQHRQVVFDPITRWYVLAWDVFGAEKFPYDEARLLALTCGVDLDRQVIKEHGAAAKSSKFVVLQAPPQRMEGHRRGNPESEPASLLDGLHLALTLYQRDGAAAAAQYLQRHHLDADVQFQALVDACLLAIPRVRPEWKTLQALAVAQFRDTSQVLEQMTMEQLPTTNEDR